ncbi:ABC transporter substrate-binding protein [Halobacteria archaeon AArc-m2/3/4]|uniref:ABC transporter substrate-binding protein n=1 Tax=Natronoglomus mannanivorans TaxID=2979990 RepID=A0AAP2YVX1_9EURY|nr:ABC transporter substrate-binding protein [Halobacteria archaeon AArc-xg1-1]MCU4971378.1 ABC transporter substrate-binding protein [Halobacteria archaeon AArc-m2/3/4]
MTHNGARSRRAYLKATATGTAILVGTTGLGQAGASAQEEGADFEEFEIVHWWTAGGEEEALNALLEGYQEEYPGVEIDNNPAPGGAGSALDAAVRSRVVDQTPPSTFQIWPGESLRPYTDADILESVEDLWDDEMREAYLESVMDVASPDDELVSVPINIHRLNNLFYNVEVVEDAGIDPDGIEDPTDLLDALETADEAGYTGMAHQTSSEWSTVQLWETVLIAEHGVETFEQYIAGETDDLEEEVRESLELVVDYSEYFSPDAGAIAWDEGNAQVIGGDAAFIHQGDWAAGQYGEADFEYEDEWDFVPFPGSDGVYSLVMDSFVMPTPNPSPAATEAFLSYCGTVDAQERFNPIKGSIPPRTDVPTDEFPPFLQDQMDDFENSDEQPTTIAHGSAVRPEIKSEIEETFSRFLETWDVDDTTQGLLQAHQAAGY